MKEIIWMTIAAFCLLIVGCSQESSNHNSRGIGIYPGNPEENFAPNLLVDNTYRNVAELRAAYNSSSYDYNLTAQLVTDGIITTEKPATIRVSTQDEELPRNAREYFFDDKPDSRYIVKGTDDIFLQLDLNNMEIVTDRFVVRGDVVIDDTKSKGYEIIAYASYDGEKWDEIGREKGNGYIGTELQTMMRNRTLSVLPKENLSPVIFKYDYQPKPAVPSNSSMFRARRMGRPLSFEVKFNETKNYKHYKITLKAVAASDWSFSDWHFYNGEELQTVLPSLFFKSAWQSATSGEEWVYVDLGTKAKFDKVNLYWINKAIKGVIQISDDAKLWRTVADLPGGVGKIDVIELGRFVESRYVRLFLTESQSNQPYILSEFQVMGKGGLIAKSHKGLIEKNDKLVLSGGNWKLQRASLINDEGESISQLGYKDESWITATVPGTVLSSFINIGAVPDPNFADNQLQISDSYFISDFWYRNEFTVNNPADYVFLNFDGINWKADIFVNGNKVGRIDGSFMRGKFDVSKQIVKGKNVIAVKIIRIAHPGAIKEKTAWSTDQNGGILGADNPTFHATIGWDWIPTIRGRDIGIWNDVFLTFNGAVTIEDPFVRTELPLPETSSADVLVELTLKNHSAETLNGVLKGKYGDVSFEQAVTLQANEAKLVKLNPSTIPALHLKNPKLWWPKGYGEPHLYDVNLSFHVDGKETDHTSFKSGVRQMTFDENSYEPSGSMSFGTFGQSEPRRLSLYINGRRFIGFGGNWGFSESNLNYRGREYDIAVAYHADMNFTMIRNWVGQIGGQELFEACDRYGVMIWQDFWLANPADGPNPYDNEMFMENAEDFVKRIRNHPSIGIYVGRNEGNPPKVLDDAIREMLSITHPDIHYISNSASGVVSGGGPYRALDPKEYFRLYGHDKFHSERGMPNVMNYESMMRTFGEENIEPVNTLATPNSIYGLHDYTLGGGVGASAQAAESFNERIAKAFGKPKNAMEFADRAQWINYEGYRAIFEGRSEHRRGMLLWMSHPAWPSMVWQTYDYYFDPTGAYFGCKKACEPIHIQWNPIRDDIEVVNYHAFNKKGIVAKAQLINSEGKVQWEKELTFDILEDQTVACFPLELPESLSPTFFIKLTLTENGKLLSDNFYLRGKEEGNYQSLNKLPKVTLTENSSVKRVGNEWFLSTKLKNDTNTPALIIRLKIEGSNTNTMILPAFYSDNYFSLMPGEEKEVSMRVYDADTKGEIPRIEICGFNI
ncbi:MAG: discoidin domain-containing protein [Parabacteroides sp.]|nr:discoidin domain-containing protein [Parabacteroides sp.]MDK2979612.1 hypothetical protein [Bacteroidales bacterium]